MDRKPNRREFIGLAAAAGAGAIAGDLMLPRACGARAEASDEMSFFEVVRNRRSVRRFKSTPVPPEHVEMILDAARLAPSSGNQQPWKFLVIRDRARLAELRAECLAWRAARYREAGQSEEQVAEKVTKAGAYFDGFLAAPVHIIVLTDSNSEWPTYNEKDGSLAAGYLILAARALGYGSVFATDSFPEEVTKKVFRIPDNYVRICYTPIGVPEEWPVMPAKRALDDFLVNETF